LERAAMAADSELLREAAARIRRGMHDANNERMGKELASLARDLRRLNRGEFPGERVGQGRRKED
jgi:hypothetical protein